MFKRMPGAILVVVALVLSIAPAASAAPMDRFAGEDGLTGFVQALWEDLTRALGFVPDPETVETKRADEPRSLDDVETVGPHIDP